MDHPLSDEQRAQLATRLEQIIAEAEAALAQRRADGETVELDQSRQGRLSRMDALQGQAMAQAAARRAEQDRRTARAALTRLADPDFGLCIDCEEPIPWARLALNPVLRRCVACAEEQEQRP